MHWIYEKLMKIATISDGHTERKSQKVNENISIKFLKWIKIFERKKK